MTKEWRKPYGESLARLEEICIKLAMLQVLEIQLRKNNKKGDENKHSEVGETPVTCGISRAKKIQCFRNERYVNYNECCCCAL